MISLALILFAAILKAIADTVMFHYDTSVFKHLPFQFWNPLESYKYVKFFPLTKYRIDGWHLANSGMIVAFIFAAVFYNSTVYSVHFAWYYGIVCYGIMFNLTFSLFYNKILRRK